MNVQQLNKLPQERITTQGRPIITLYCPIVVS